MTLENHVMEESGRKRRAVLAGIAAVGVGGFYMWRYGGGDNGEGYDDESPLDGLGNDTQTEGEETTPNPESQETPTQDNTGERDTEDEGDSPSDDNGSGEESNDSDSGGADERDENEGQGDDESEHEYEFTGEDEIETAGSQLPDYTNWLTDDSESPYVHACNLPQINDAPLYRPLLEDYPFESNYIASRTGSDNLLEPVDGIGNLAEGVPIAGANKAMIVLSQLNLFYAFVEEIDAEWVPETIDKPVMSLDELQVIEDGVILYGGVDHEVLQGKDSIEESETNGEYTLYDDKLDSGGKSPFAARGDQIIVPIATPGERREKLNELIAMVNSNSGLDDEFSQLATDIGTGAAFYASRGADIRSNFSNNDNEEGTGIGVGLNDDVEEEFRTALNDASAVIMATEQQDGRRVTRTGAIFDNLDEIEIRDFVGPLIRDVEPEEINTKTDGDRLLAEIFWE